MSELLSAASLMMAVIAMLYGLWYSEVVAMLKITPNRYSEDNLGLKAEVKRVMLTKMLLLVIMSLSVVIIFFPDFFRIIGGIIDNFTNGQPQSYDAIKTAYCFVFLFTLILTCHSSVLFWQLFCLWRRLGITEVKK